MVSHHRGATTRRADDVVIGGKRAQKTLGEWSGLVGAARVGHRLSATGLAARILYFSGVRLTELLKQRQCRQTDMRIELINVTGNEERYPQWIDREELRNVIGKLVCNVQEQ
jgi:hypothetical protein